MKHSHISSGIRKAAILFPSVAILLTGATSCTTNTWQETHAVCPHVRDNPEDKDKFGPEGHMNTTYVVSRIAGNSEKTSLRLSHFSQAPDDLAFLYSAPAVAIWGSAQPGWGYRHRIVNVLHSLHGGDTAAVYKRRADLKRLITGMRKDGTEDWKTGFLIHAYGDSYAHVKGPEDQPVAYGELVGHGFDRTVCPDHIEHHMDNYGKYVRNLYQALETEKGDPDELDDFIRKVKAASKLPDAEKEVAKAIVCFRFEREVLLQADLLDPKERTRRWNREIRFTEVNRFLGEMRGKL